MIAPLSASGCRIAAAPSHSSLNTRATASEPHVGCFSNGSPGELFLDAAKQNSGLDALAADAAILISLLLQHGSTAAAIGLAILWAVICLVSLPDLQLGHRLYSTAAVADLGTRNAFVASAMRCR